MTLFANIYVKTMLVTLLAGIFITGTYSDFMASSFLRVNACPGFNTNSDLSASSLLSCSQFCFLSPVCEAFTYLGGDTRRCLLHGVQLVDGGCRNTSVHFNKVVCGIVHIIPFDRERNCLFVVLN